MGRQGNLEHCKVETLEQLGGYPSIDVEIGLESETERLPVRLLKVINVNDVYKLMFLRLMIYKLVDLPVVVSY